MIQIDDKIVSFDLIEEYFFFFFFACKGVCCVEGDAGAPLKNSELKEIENNFEAIKKYLPEKNLKEIQKQGLYYKDNDGDNVTPCIDNKDCVFLTKIDGIYLCAYEIAFLKKEINFWKPLSCHLYPILITKYKDFTAVNYQKRELCRMGRVLGYEKKIKVYEFLKAPLIRAFGEEWFEKLDYAAKNYKIER